MFVQNLETGLFMDATSIWGPEGAAYNFRTPSFAIELCIMRRLRNVRVIVDSGDPAEKTFLDVHVGSLSALRAGISQNRELRARQQVLKAELDAIRAGQKERKKQIPFRRKQVAEEQNSPDSTDFGD